MKLKHILALLFSAAFVFSFSACKDNEDSSSSTSSPTSIDSSDNGGGGDENAEDNCTFTLSTDEGDVAANVKFTLTAGESTYNLTANANGVATAELPVGTYSIEYDDTTLPTGCIPDVFSVTVTDTAKAFTLLLIDNNPNGSANKPFVIMDDATEVYLNAGEEFYYRYRGERATLYVGSDSVSVVYNGTTYAPEDGKVTVEIAAADYTGTIFSIKNTGTRSVETEIEIVFPLGSTNNPIEIEDISSPIPVNVPKGGSMYYKWTATESGTLTVSTDNMLSHVSFYNSSTGVYANILSGVGTETLACTEGDVIIIEVSCNNPDQAANITFTLAITAA